MCVLFVRRITIFLNLYFFLRKLVIKIKRFTILPTPKCLVTFQMSSLKYTHIYIIFILLPKTKQNKTTIWPASLPLNLVDVGLRTEWKEASWTLGHMKKQESFHSSFSGVTETLWNRCGVRGSEHFLLWVKHQMVLTEQGVKERLPP